jgi:hypothetical protein
MESNNLSPISTKLSIMKPIRASWIISYYQYMFHNPEIIHNGLESAGIADMLNYKFKLKIFIF